MTSDGSELCTDCGKWIAWNGEGTPQRGMCTCHRATVITAMPFVADYVHVHTADGSPLPRTTIHVENRTGKPIVLGGGIASRASRFLDAPELDAAELELDAFERIEKAAAEWRNAYRALERGDREALARHSSAAIAHTNMLWDGLR